MNLETFSGILLKLQDQDRTLSELYDKNVDLIEFVDPYHSIISDLIREIYGEDGYGWWSWFCYENGYGEKKLEAFDNGEPICYNIESLWQYLENNKGNGSK